MKFYLLIRDEDVSGQSGTGIVAEIFEDFRGRVELRWRLPPYGCTTYESLEDLIKVHGHGGRTYAVKLAEIPTEIEDLALEWYRGRYHLLELELIAFVPRQTDAA